MNHARILVILVFAALITLAVVFIKEPTPETSTQSTGSPHPVATKTIATVPVLAPIETTTPAPASNSTDRDAVPSAEQSLSQRENALEGVDPERATAPSGDSSEKVESERASVTRSAEAKRAAEASAQHTALARQRIGRDEAERYAQTSYWRGQQLEGSAQAAFRSLDYGGATSLYTSATREYERALTMVARGRSEEQLRTSEEQQRLRKQAQEAARRLKEEEEARELQRKEEQEQQELREQNALRANATGKIRKVRLDTVTYGGGLNPELQILVDFEISGMKGVDGEVIAFLYVQQVVGFFERAKGPYEPLIGSGSDRNGVYALARYTPGYENSQYSKFPLSVPFSRITLPKGTSRVMAAVSLRTGGEGEFERDLDSRSEVITLVQK